MANKVFRSFIKWALGVHGAVHVIETAVNMYEGAWLSALISGGLAFVMIAGATMGIDHNKSTN